MKKIIFSLVALLAVGFTACTEFDEPVVENYGEGPAIGVSAVVSDSTITLTMTVDTLNTAYFSYALYEGETNTPDAAQLLKATAGGMDAKMFAVAKEEWNGVNAKNVSFTGLMPNTTYHIYAVASSQFGVIGAVADTLVVTTDGVSPVPAAISGADNKLSVTFAESMVRGEGAVTAEYYQPYGDLTAAYAAVDSADILVSISGADVTIETANVPAGAIVLVSWEAGAFVDEVGNPCNAQVTSFDEEGQATNGCVFTVPNAPFAIAEDAVEGGAFQDWEGFVGSIKCATDLFVYEGEDAAAAEDFYVVYSGGNYETKIYVENWTVADSCILFALPKEPDFGAYVGVNVPANLVCDVYGNVNEEFAAEKAWLRSYGLNIGSVVGKYDFTYFSARYGEEVTETVLITENPAVEKGLFISNLLSAGTVVEAVFDGDYANVIIPSMQLLLTNSAGNQFCFVEANGGENVELQINPSDSTMTSVATEYAFGYYIADAGQWYDYAAGSLVATRSADQNYGMTRDMVLGNYNWNYTSNFDGPGMSMAVSIEANPESETGVLLKNMLVPGSVVKGEFNAATGEVAFEGGQALFVSEANNQLYAFETYDLTHVVFNVAADGSMKASANRSAYGALWGILVYDATTFEQLGWYDLAVGDILMLKATDDETEEAEEAPARVRALQNVTLHTDMMPVQNKWAAIEGPARK